MANKKTSKGHVVLPGSKREKDRFASRIGDIDPKEKIEVTIELSGPKLPSADEYVGQTMTPAELAKSFGAKKEDAAKTAKTLRKFGLQVEKVSLETRTISFS